MAPIVVTHLGLIAAFALWSGFVWRLRGGALTTLLRINLGTDGARGICGILLAVPLAWLTHDWRPLVLAPAIFMGLLMAGWGPFQGMGLENVPGYLPERSWMRLLPGMLGLRAGSMGHDIVGMAEAGIVAMVPAAAAVAWIWGWSAIPAAAVIAAGALFPLPYLLARLSLPNIRGFARHQAWGEVGAGILVGASLAWSLLA